MSVDIYLNFAGNCREAVEYYAKVFGLDSPKIMTFGDTPENPDYPLPEEAKKLGLSGKKAIESIECHEGSNHSVYKFQYKPLKDALTGK